MALVDEKISDGNGDNYMSKTIEYYDSNADGYYDSTVNSDMGAQYNMFEKRLYIGAHILALGCDSGRDAKYFLEQGYEVTAIDGSEKLCDKASTLTGLEVRNVLIQDIDYVDEFDGVWACASLAHISLDELPEILQKISTSLKDGGIFYLSFKIGDFSGECDDRFLTDMNEETISNLISEIPELSIQETAISNDVRDGVDNQWISVVIIKHENRALKTRDELVETNDVEMIEGEIVLDKSGNKVLRIIKSMTDVDYMGVLDKVAQYVNMANIARTIEKGVEYVVQIPAKYQRQFETGEYFINKNKTTGIEWPTLMRKAENGQYRFVDDLPIKQQEFIKSNPFQDICNSYHNIVMQQQLVQIADMVAETYETVKMIEVGQQDDRIALIESGKEQILLAMSIQDEVYKKDLLKSGVHDLLLGREQIGKALMRRVEAFKALPDNRLSMFFTTLTRSGYLSKKDDEVEAIQECYSMYIEATKMLAVTFAYTGETAAVEQTFKKSISFLKEIDFSAVRTIGFSHKNVDLSEWFFNHPVEYIEVEKTPCLESAKEYDYVHIEVIGDVLLEVIKDGREEISETEAE